MTHENVAMTTPEMCIRDSSMSERGTVLHHQDALSLHQIGLGNGNSAGHLKYNCLGVVQLYVLPNRLNVTLLGGIYLIDHDRIRAPQIYFTGEVSQFMARAVRVGDNDFQIGNIEAVSYTHLDVYKRQNSMSRGTVNC